MQRFQNYGSKNKIILYFIVFGLVIIGGLVFLVKAKFKVVNVFIEGNEHYTNEEIKDMVLGDGVNENSLFLYLKYRNKEISDIPFIEAMSVEVVSPDSVKVMVYEKALAGCVEYLGKYMYFDREGIICESANELSEGIPQVTGLQFGYIVLYDPLPTDNAEIFQEILNITQLLAKYEIGADRIHFDKSLQVTLYFKEVRVALGSNEWIDEKIMFLKNVIPTLEGKNGILRMESYEPDTENVTFEIGK